MKGTHISMATAWDALQEHPARGRAFTAVLDLNMNWVVLFQHVHDYATAFPQTFQLARSLSDEDRDVLRTEALFKGKLDVHSRLASFVLRHRAVWDKVLGLVVLLDAPDHCKRFKNNRSRKKGFKSVMNGVGPWDEAMIDRLLSQIQQFDDK